MNLHYIEQDLEVAIANNIGGFLDRLMICADQPVVVGRQLRMGDMGICDVLAVESVTRSDDNGSRFARAYVIEVKRHKIDESAVCQVVRYLSQVDGWDHFDWYGRMPRWAFIEKGVRLEKVGVLTGPGITPAAEKTIEAFNSMCGRHEIHLKYVKSELLVGCSFAGERGSAGYWHE